ncbi:MAG TPA: alpha/beta fold hydrolase [Deltaproteobacteria bacterium]|nr:alpha/beta fold hydrolase [Deltaproteobacteria bacterium]
MRPAFLFLHGWACDSRVWDDAARELARGPALNLDLPGHGRAATPWSAPGLEPAVRELLGSTGAGGPFVAVGWSLGAKVLIEAAAREPARFAALVLVGASPCFTRRRDFPWGQSAALVRRMIRDVERDPAAALERFYPLCFTGEELASDGARRFLSLYTGRKDRRDGASMLAALRALDTADLRRRLAAVEAPTLVVHGACDGVCPVGAGRFLAERLRRAELAEIEGAGHAPFLTRPKEFMEIMNKFLQHLDMTGLRQ